MFKKLKDWLFPPAPKWDEFSRSVNPERFAPGAVVMLDEHGRPEDEGDQWRENFSLTAGQRSERSRKAAATKKARKARAKGE